jgi:uncharacterized protein (DUF1501 family)
MHSSRRDFLKSASLLALTPTLPGFLAQTARAAKPDKDGRVLVVIQLGGGNDGINTVVPYADEGYAKHRKVLRLAKESLIKLDDRVGLNRAMGDAAKLLETGRMAIIQGVGYPNPSRSHFKSMAIWHSADVNLPRGDAPDAETKAAYGWLGRAFDSAPHPASGGPASLFIGRETPPAALRGRRSVASGLASLEDFTVELGGHPAKTVADPEPGDGLAGFIRRSTLDAYAAADRMDQIVRAKDTGPRYPDTRLAAQLRLIARLLKAGYSARVFYTTHTQFGYDTHYAQLVTHFNLLAELSGALRAFLDDLASANLADRVAILAFSEFGRRVAENGSAGTDHGTAGPVFLAGSRVRSGLVGTTPSLTDLQDGDLKTSIDFRQVYATVLEDWLGVSARAALGGEFNRLALFEA